MLHPFKVTWIERAENQVLPCGSGVRKSVRVNMRAAKSFQKFYPVLDEEEVFPWSSEEIWVFTV